MAGGLGVVADPHHEALLGVGHGVGDGLQPPVRQHHAVAAPGEGRGPGLVGREPRPGLVVIHTCGKLEL